MPHGEVTLGTDVLSSRAKIKEWKPKLDKFNLEIRST